VKGLREELARVGISGRLARRIELELDDHARCDPGARLGSPQLIAERFAAELRLPRTRGAVHTGFVALALLAVDLAVLSASALPHAHATSGLLVSLAGLAIVLGAQVSFVGGLLALWGVHRGTQLRTVQRRTGVALVAGSLVVAGLIVDLAWVRAPPWWYALALLPALGLARSGLALREANALTPPAGGGGIAFTRGAVIAIGGSAGLLVAVGSAFAERSWVEGLTRGVFEAVAFAACFLVLGRRLGIRR
jgi:hypothetical protein